MDYGESAHHIYEGKREERGRQANKMRTQRRHKLQVQYERARWIGWYMI